MVNVSVPFVLTGLPLTAGALHRSRRPDHQTATLAWGDGPRAQTVFTLSTKRSATAPARSSHSIGTPCRDRSRSSSRSPTTTAASAARRWCSGAHARAGGRADHRPAGRVIAATTDGDIRKDLEKARKALAGNPRQQRRPAQDPAGNDRRRSPSCTRRPPAAAGGGGRRRTRRRWSRWSSRSWPPCPPLETPLAPRRRGSNPR